MLPVASPAMPAVVQQIRGANDASSTSVAPKEDHSFHLPRIVCLHGGGTNARIFRVQCRIIQAHLAPYFRLVFVDAPFLIHPSPDVESVYAELAPFRSWLRPGSGFETGVDLLEVDEVVIESVDRCIETAMREDDKAGATGAWVGLLGFSLGAKMAASLLLRQQNQNCEHGNIPGKSTKDQEPRVNYRFAVLIAGRAPLISMVPAVSTPPLAESANQDLLKIPTIHVHGLRDAVASVQTEMLYHRCEKSYTRLVEWDGDHRVPIKTADVAAVVSEILDIANETGAMV